MQIPNIRNSREIAAGGEGKIVEHPNGKDVIKVYHQARHISFEKHLQDLVRLSDSFVKPIDIYTDNSMVIGFSMKYVNLNNYWLFNNLFNKGFCTSNNIDNDFKINVLNKLKKELQEIHSKGIVIGDLNQYNIFVNEKAEILFVDVDSFKTTNQNHSGVLLDDIRDWTTIDINDKTDAWAYDILAFWSLTYCHPFKWVLPGNKETIEQRVKGQKSILSKIAGIKIPALYQKLPIEIEDQYNEIFKGRRYMVSLDGSVAKKAPTVITQPVPTSDLIIRPVLNDVSLVYANGNQITVRMFDGTWKLIVTDTLKIMRELRIDVKAEYVYPSFSIGDFAYIKDNSIYSGQKQVLNNSFKSPEMYFVNGSLMVIDYAQDNQYNYSINNQLAGSIQKTITPIFAKSVLFRGAPIQNFGVKKFLNIPNKDRYTMCPIPSDTKDAHVSGDFIAIEEKQKTTEYKLYADNKPIMDLDYLPFFASKDRVVIIPEDGYIEVVDFYGSTIRKFIVSNCTRTSRLYNTNSGILMLENKTLYLLNTK